MPKYTKSAIYLCKNKVVRGGLIGIWKCRRAGKKKKKKSSKQWLVDAKEGSKRKKITRSARPLGL